MANGAMLRISQVRRLTSPESLDWPKSYGRSTGRWSSTGCNFIDCVNIIRRSDITRAMIGHDTNVFFLLGIDWQ